MSAYLSEKPVDHPTESGWAQSRDQQEGSPRTCVPAVGDAPAPEICRGPDWNIVRGED
ncbi:hypothetical protein ABZ468_05270 [Streptomyces sp. NPDC005708]|uniref:hypothetical protein n=1 Tax=unclassified Streptomyces TaxID=2593676 RepID=UPI0033DCE451